MTMEKHHSLEMQFTIYNMVLFPAIVMLYSFHVFFFHCIPFVVIVDTYTSGNLKT